MIDQPTVLRQIDVAVWSMGGAHMMLWAEQAQGSNVITDCACVSALLNPPLGFRGRTKRPCHFVHLRPSRRIRDAISCQAPRRLGAVLSSAVTSQGPWSGRFCLKSLRSGSSLIQVDA